MFISGLQMCTNGITIVGKLTYIRDNQKFNADQLSVTTLTNIPIQGGNATRKAFSIRDTFKEFFSSSIGSIPWQNNLRSSVIVISISCSLFMMRFKMFNMKMPVHTCPIHHRSVPKLVRAQTENRSATNFF
ncbi:protein ANTAGONIST OF LIKE HETEROCHROMATIN PROTEIN 1-like [Aphis craccivora]|uniref:Protein ANTAGONIST OF LIKE HETEROCHROMATIN PROTEIN 1-like n=1 Tax=Aphis craccivora TaxID=307492 RepID=A0A6G0VI96_APHCR|nr:protein ANTAGONIST OF LIKE HETEROCHROMATIN PROTEIN 1-like [Aphis craccivora]